MVKQIKERYNRFSDSVIYRWEYNPLDIDFKSTSATLSVFIRCLNLQNSIWENVKIDFNGVTEFRFVETSKRKNSTVFEALIEQKGDEVIFDFFPIQVDGKGELKEDSNSDFSIHCASLSYELLV